MTFLRKKLAGLGQNGFTLVEMIVVMAVFISVIVIAGESFKTILTKTSILSKSAESNIEGMVGLEMFRHDLNQTGFGLPWGNTGASFPAYAEAVDSPASLFNDSDKTNKIPRAVIAGNNLTTGVLPQTDYLVLKGTTLARNKTAQEWTYVNYSSSGKAPKTWSSGNLTTNDYVIVLRRVFTETGYVNQLVQDNGTFSQKFPTDKLATAFQPVTPQETYYIYGILAEDPSDPYAPQMPFNRTDFYVKRPTSNMPASCASNTGKLYMATLNHKDGKLTEIPILDCVADMQITFGWDMNDDGVADVSSSADGSSVDPGDTSVIAAVQSTLQDAALIRNRLKFIKVYLLTQDGRRDPHFRNEKDIVVGDPDKISLTKQYTVANLNTAGWTNYRWKVYRIVVSPKNLMLN